MEYKKLSEVCDVRDGTHDSPKYVTEGYPLVTSKNIVDGKLDLSVINYLSQEDYDKINERSKVDVGDIIMPMIGTIGNPYIVEDFTDFAIKNVALVKFPYDSIDNRYVWYYLKSESFNRYVVEKNKGGTQKFLSLGDIRSLNIPVINKNEQAEIVELLDKVSSIIDLRKDELIKLDELIKARFVELFGDSIINSKNLETKDLKDVLILKAGDFTAASDIVDEPSESNPYPCYGGNGIRGYVSEYNQEGEYSLVGRQGALSGNVQFASGKFKNTEHALLVTPVVEMNCIWLNQLLLNLDLTRYQTGAAQPGLSVKNLQEIPIIMVPVGEQKVFAEFVKQVDKSKFAVQKALDEAQLLFDSLMQEYFG